MCGRARSTRPASAVARTFGVAPQRIYNAGQWQPQHNFHPSQPSPVLVREEGRRRAYHSFSAAPATVEPHSGFPPSAGADVKTHGDALEKNEQQGIGQAEFTSPPPPQAGVTSVVVMKWGLVPSWHKKEEKPDFFRAFNARSETVSSKPFFKRLVNSRRCVVVLDGFYEWVLDEKKQKQPYYVHHEDDRPMTFAGLYDCWEGPGGELLYTYTILTREPSPSWAWLHNRFPLVLPSKEAEEEWLDVAGHKAEDILPRLRQPVDIPGMVSHPCSKKMNNMKYDGEDAADPVKLETPGKGAAAAGTPTLHKFFKGKGKEDKGPTPGEVAAASTRLNKGGMPEKGEKEEGSDDDDDVVILTPSKEEAAGGGDVGKHAADVVGAQKGGKGGGGGKKRPAAESGNVKGGKRQKKGEGSGSEQKAASKAFFPKSK